MGINSSYGSALSRLYLGFVSALIVETPIKTHGQPLDHPVAAFKKRHERALPPLLTRKDTHAAYLFARKNAIIFTIYNPCCFKKLSLSQYPRWKTIRPF